MRACVSIHFMWCTYIRRLCVALPVDVTKFMSHIYGYIYGKRELSIALVFTNITHIILCRFWCSKYFRIQCTIHNIYISRIKYYFIKEKPLTKTWNFSRRKQQIFCSLFLHYPIPKVLFTNFYFVKIYKKKMNY